MHVDYLIVGDGYAGVFFAHQLIKNKKSFRLFSAGKRAASHISAGACNPVILSRFNKIWKHQELMNYLPIAFSEVSEYLGKNYLLDQPVVRVFHDEAERNTWLEKAHSDKLSHEISDKVLELHHVNNPYGGGKVIQSSRVDVLGFFKAFHQYLEEQGVMIKESFNYQLLDAQQKTYGEISFDKIVFAEGVKVKDNPYFGTAPVVPNKGHRLSISIDEILDPYIISKKHFLVKMSEEDVYYGGTNDKLGDGTEQVEQKSVDDLVGNLEDLYPHHYRVNQVLVAQRATVPDRRPIIGRHNSLHDFYIFNGLGARGALNGSFFSKMLYDFIENNGMIFPEADVQRFYLSNKML